MSFPRLLGAALVRTVVLTALYVVFVLALSRSDSADALGAGLLFFLLVVVLAFGWAGYDGARRGLAPALVVWVVTGAATGVALVAGFVVGESEGPGFVEELRSSWLFFALLVALPAAVGALVGGLVHRLRAPRPVG